jgi:hypothetical protein
MAGIKYIDAMLANSNNAVQVPEKISYTEFITFFQRTVDCVFLTGVQSDNTRRPSISSLDFSQQDQVNHVPPVAMALRLCVEIFRVVSNDQSRLSASTII